MAYSPIQCHLYDYIEIACLRHYTLEILLITSDTITGKAQTTLIKNKEEFLILEVNGEEQKVRLDKIKSITALDDGAEFQTIEIN